MYLRPSARGGPMGLGRVVAVADRASPRRARLLEIRKTWPPFLASPPKQTYVRRALAFPTMFPVGRGQIPESSRNVQNAMRSFSKSVIEPL